MQYCIQVWKPDSNKCFTEILVPRIESIQIDWGHQIVRVVSDSGTVYRGIPSSIDHPSPNDEDYDFHNVVTSILEFWRSYWDSKPEGERWIEEILER